jgi:hypothetical protein
VSAYYYYYYYYYEMAGAQFACLDDARENEEGKTAKPRCVTTHSALLLAKGGRTFGTMLVYWIDRCCCTAKMGLRRRRRRRRR